MNDTLKDIVKSVNKVMATLGKKTVEFVGSELKRHRLRNLIRECFSEDKATKFLALAKLKKEFPEAYKEVKKEMK